MNNTLVCLIQYLGHTPTSKSYCLSEIQFWLATLICLVGFCSLACSVVCPLLNVITLVSVGVESHFT